MTARNEGDGLEVAVARIEEKVESVLQKVECLPGVCQTQARHDERIGALERAGRWILGIAATLLTGLGLSLFGFVKQIYAHMIAGGGKP